MSRVFVVLVAFLAATAAKQQELSVVAQEQQAQSSGHVAAIDYSVQGKKYSAGAELTNLAHSSAQQASTAVRNQQTAGLQASLSAQTGYAHAASEAASAARVAFVAKQFIVENIQRHIEDANHQLQAEQAQYQQSLKAASVAHTTAKQSRQLLSSASQAYAAVQQSVTEAERAATAAGQAAATQHQMIQDAEQRLARLHQQLYQALEGLQETQFSAQKAAASAQVAQSNAAASAQLTVVNSASNPIDDYHF